MRKSLSGNELTIFNKLHDTGKLDLTGAHDLIDAANHNTPVNQSSAWNTFMKVAALPQHASEVINRQVTAIASIRLEMEKSNDAEKAFNSAINAIDQTHYDYDKSNRAMIMQGNTQRVVFMFKQYAQKTAFLWGHTAKIALKGATVEERSIARKQIVGMLLMQTAFAGILGLPIYAEAAVIGAGVVGFKALGKKGAYAGSALALAAIIAAAMGDDDPDEMDAEVRRYMADMFGNTWGEVISRGAFRMANIDISQRVSASELILRKPDKDTAGDSRTLDWIEAILGYSVGQIATMASGLSMMADGHVERGVEKIVPVKALRDAMQAGRYLNEGVETLRGDKIIDEVTNYENILKLMGFTPGRVAEAYERNSAIKTPEIILNRRRSNLLKEYVNALKNDEDVSAVNADIAEFNEKYPSHLINGMSKKQSYRASVRADLETEGGLRISRKHNDLRDKGDFANL